MFAPILIAVVISAAVAFPCGVIVAKTIISDAEEIKAHVSAEVLRLRNDLKMVAGKL